MLTNKSIDLIVPAKEKKQNIVLLLKNLLKINNINKIIIILPKNISKFFFKHPKVMIVNQKRAGYGSAIIEGFANQIRNEKANNMNFICLEENIIDKFSYIRYWHKKFDDDFLRDMCKNYFKEK